MAYAKTEGETKDDSSYEYQYRKDYEDDWKIHQDYVQSFDAYEAMLIGQVFDSVSNSIDGSKITDSYAMTLAKERADRVIAKLPDGETEPTGKADVGKAAFMDILRQKWIYPNANSQHSFLEKLNMWQLYSSVYGYMPMFYDWNVSSTGYVGPDCWLWNPRNLVPQQGRASLPDMEYVTALTWVGKKYLESIIEKEVEGDGWDRGAVEALLEKVTQSSSSPDAQKDTQVMRTRTPQITKRGICLATRYEAGDDGEWCTFAPDYGYIEVRKIENPHKNGRIPFVIKYSQPLFDSFYGLGDFQRAKPLQFGRDGLRNFYFKGVKMNLIPPIVANANGVVKHTLDYREGAVMLETIPNSIRRLETSTAGLATYQAAMSDLTGSLLSLYGTQNGSIPGSEALNPSQGKTPGAIDMYTEKEATRDGAERRHLETAIEELTDGFFSLVANIGTEEIPINLFADDIEDIRKAGLTDVLSLFAGKFQPNETLTGGQLKIRPEALKGIEYRFNITTGSTAKISKEKQLEQLERLVGNLGKFQNIFKDDPRVQIHPDRIAAAFGYLADIKGADEFVTVSTGPSPKEQELQQQLQELQQQNQQLQQKAAAPQPKPVSESLNYKDAPDDIRRQIEAQAGLQPSVMPASELPAQPPTVNGMGHMFHDPEIAKVAETLGQPSSPLAAPQRPHATVNNSGQMFADPELSKVADAVSKM